MKAAMGVASLALCLTLGAGAATLQGDDAACAALMGSVLDATSLRDAGMPWGIAKPQLEDAIQRAMGQEGSIVQDEDDAALIRRVFEDMWTQGQDSLTATLQAYATCMAQQ